MKKFLFIIAALAAVYFTSCQQEPVETANQQEEVSLVSEDEIAAFPKVIYVSVEGDDTKSGMDRYYDDGTSSYKYRHHWDEGDVIYVYHSVYVGPGKSDYMLYKSSYSCVNAASGTFSLTDTESGRSAYDFNQFCAVFTNTGGRIIVDSNNNLRVESAGFPTTSELTYTSASSTPGYGNIMAAVSADGEHYKFTSLLGWMKLQLKGTKTVSSFVINADYATPLCSYVDVTYPTSGTVISAPTYGDTMDEDGIANLTVNLPTPVTLNESTATDFYIALPPMTRNLSTGLQINFTDGTNEVLSTSNNITIEANMVTPMAEKEVGVLYSILCTGVNFNSILKTLAAGSDKTASDDDTLIKGIELSLSESSPSATSTNLADDGEPVYATFDSGTGVITLHTSADKVRLHTDCQEMFERMTVLESVGILSQIIRSEVGEVYNMFYNCSKLESVDLSQLDISHTTRANGMFAGCSSLASIDLSPLNTSSVKSFSGMFQQCTSLTSLDVSCLDTKAGITFTDMFSNCTNLASIDFGASFFKNSDICSIDGMFYNCSSLERIELTGTATASLTIYLPYANLCAICANCTSLTSFRIALPGRVSDLSYIFRYCEELETIDMDYIEDYYDPNYAYAFDGCKKLNTLKISQWYCAYISSGNLSNPKIQNMFRNTCTKSTGLDIYMRGDTQYGYLSLYFNDTMKADGFVTLHTTP